MDKIFSARLDESVLLEMDRVVTQQRMTKKKFLEQAIRQMAENLSVPEEKDVWEIIRRGIMLMRVWGLKNEK